MRRQARLKRRSRQKVEGRVQRQCRERLMWHGSGVVGVAGVQGCALLRGAKGPWTGVVVHVVCVGGCAIVAGVARGCGRRVREEGCFGGLGGRGRPCADGGAVPARTLLELVSRKAVWRPALLPSSLREAAGRCRQRRRRRQGCRGLQAARACADAWLACQCGVSAGPAAQRRARKLQRRDSARAVCADLGMSRCGVSVACAGCGGRRAFERAFHDACRRLSMCVHRMLVLQGFFLRFFVDE